MFGSCARCPSCAQLTLSVPSGTKFPIARDRTTSGHFGHIPNKISRNGFESEPLADPAPVEGLRVRYHKVHTRDSGVYGSTTHRSREVRSGNFAEFLARAVLFTLGGIAGKEVVNLGPAGLVIPCTSVLQRVNPGGSEECKIGRVSTGFSRFHSTIAFASFCFLKFGWLFTGPDWLFFAPVGCSLLLCFRTFSA